RRGAPRRSRLAAGRAAAVLSGGAQLEQGLLRLGIERVACDGHLVPGAGLGVTTQGRTSGPELPRQGGVVPRPLGGRALDQRVEPLALAGDVAERGGGRKIADHLQGADQAKERLAG